MPHESHTYRILDANANRAGEALRVVEEYLRFALGDAHLAGIAKRLRHELTAALAELPREARLAARDTRGDVGTALTTAAESTRTDLAAVAAANLRRLGESLRALEEYGKLLAPPLAARFEALRYESYTLEKAVGATERARARLAECRLYVLVDGGDSEAAFARRIAEVIAAGADCIQLRDKQLPDRELLSRARALRKLTAEADVLFIMNDRADLALLAAADGVHVGQEELAPAEARAIVGPNSLIGVSTHSIEQARAAVLAGADYLGCGPCFPSQTKTFDTFPGPAFLREVAAEISLPAFAIGGINSANIEEVIAAGFGRVAVSGAGGLAELKGRLR